MGLMGLMGRIAGRIENAQVAVYPVHAGQRGHTEADRELYVPRSWTADPDRCRAAGIPEERASAPKPDPRPATTADKPPRHEDHELRLEYRGAETNAVGRGERPVTWHYCRSALGRHGVGFPPQTGRPAHVVAPARTHAGTDEPVLLAAGHGEVGRVRPAPDFHLPPTKSL